MRLLWNNGLIIVDTDTKLAIDCSKAENAIVTHAHADHVVSSGKSTIYASKETNALIEANYRKPKKACHLNYKHKIQFNNLEISLHNSGHILGSAQVLVENGCSLAITSDFKLQDSLLFKGAEPLESDILIIESTFGSKRYCFPEREEVYEKMAHWIRKQLSLHRFVVLSGYALGKAQELTAFVNEYLGITPLVHKRVYINNEVYRKAGIKLGDYILLHHNLNDSDILILPPNLCTIELFEAMSFTLNRKVASAKASGWPFKGCFDTVFPLSDHADFKQLMQYVELAQPKIVYTAHGFARELAYYIGKRFKVPAMPLSECKQHSLACY